MKVIETTIPDIKTLEPKVYGEERGFFFERFNQNASEEAARLSPVFVQYNHSKSVKGILHNQLPPTVQGKLLRVLQEEVFDVAVDIRKNSPTFCQWVSETLSAENKKQLWIPEGFIHGIHNAF